MHAVPPPPTAIVQRVTARASSLTFELSRQPKTIRTAWVAASQLHDCASDRAYALPGKAFAVVHLFPARSAHRMGPFPNAVKICDFESDVAWAIGLAHKKHIEVSRRGTRVTVTFGG